MSWPSLGDPRVLTQVGHVKSKLLKLLTASKIPLGLFSMASSFISDALLMWLHFEQFCPRQSLPQSLRESVRAQKRQGRDVERSLSPGGDVPNALHQLTPCTSCAYYIRVPNMLIASSCHIPTNECLWICDKTTQFLKLGVRTILLVLLCSPPEHTMSHLSCGSGGEGRVWTLLAPVGLHLTILPPFPDCCTHTHIAIWH